MRHIRIDMTFVALIVAVAGGTVAEAGGPAGGIGFSRSWGTSFVPPTIGRVASPAVPSPPNAPSVPPTAWFQLDAPVQRGPVLRQPVRRSPLVKSPAPLYDTTGGCYFP